MNVLRTPLIPYSSRIRLKPENLQPFGSYKLRGVARVLAAAPATTREVHAASAGNMAQAVAYLAREQEFRCRIFVPTTAPRVKVAAIRAMGARVEELPFTEVWQMVRTPPAASAGVLYIHPVFTPGLLEGYGTIATEILSDAPDVDAVVVPFGVGGLTLGLARAFVRLGATGVRIFACEPATAAPYQASCRAGRAMVIDRVPSFIDAIGTGEVLPEVFAELRAFGVESVVVEVDDVRSALRTLLRTHSLVCEGAGAAGLAGAIALGERFRRVVAVLSGGNIAVDVRLD